MKKVSIAILIALSSIIFSGCVATGNDSIKEAEEESKFIEKCKDLGGEATAYGFSSRKNYCNLEYTQ